jgi:hypothetical protein
MGMAWTLDGCKTVDFDIEIVHFESILLIVVI